MAIFRAANFKRRNLETDKEVEDDEYMIPAIRDLDENHVQSTAPRDFGGLGLLCPGPSRSEPIPGSHGRRRSNVRPPSDAYVSTIPHPCAKLMLLTEVKKDTPYIEAMMDDAAELRRQIEQTAYQFNIA